MTAFARRLATATLIAAAGALGAFGAATEAQAQPIKQIDAYNTCYKQSKPREGSTAASFDCCVVAGGTWNGGTYPEGFCELKNAPVPRTGGNTTLTPAQPLDPTRASTA